MNTINEIIDVKEITKGCRVMYLNDLIRLLQSNINIYWSWGCHNITVNTKCFRMNVRGHHHKGHVYIFLNGLDLFDVYLTSAQGKIKTIGEGLYNDMLVEWIDEHIEKIKDYKF